MRTVSLIEKTAKSQIPNGLDLSLFVDLGLGFVFFEGLTGLKKADSGDGRLERAD